MPTLEQKKEVVSEITELLKDAGAVYVTNYTNMSVDELTALRTKFRESGVNYKVFKNTLLKRAMDEVGGYEALYDHLEEQNAFAFVQEDLAAPAKVIKESIKQSEKPAFKAAIIDGVLYDNSQLETLASLKSRTEIIGDILGLLTAPMSNVVGAIQSPGRTIASALSTIAEKAES
jgi:large subunit ribosomal protein L10